MLSALIVVTYLFGFLAATFWILLGVTLTKGQRQRYPFLKRLDGKKLPISVAAVVFFALFYGANAAREILGPKPLVQLTPMPLGELVQKATPTGFKKELEEVVSERMSEAADYFNAGERDYDASRYKDAAGNYAKSINAIPTMSGYMNLGLSLMITSNVRLAKEAFLSGIQIARKKRHLFFEAAFLFNVGIVYLNELKLDEALKSFQAAQELGKLVTKPQMQVLHLAPLVGMGFVHLLQENFDEAVRSFQAAVGISERMPDLSVKLAVLANIGYAYFKQGRVQEALKSWEVAHELSKQVGDAQGRALGIGAMGAVYLLQQNLGEALKSFQALVELGQQSGSPAFQIQGLGGIGSVYLLQGKFEEGRRSFHAALELSRQMESPLLQTAVFRDMGGAYLLQGRLNEALSSFQTMLELGEQIGSLLIQARALSDIGFVYFEQAKVGIAYIDQAKLDVALKSHLAALRLYKNLGIPRCQIWSLINVGTIYASQGKLDEALKAFQVALRIQKGIEGSSSWGRCGFSLVALSLDALSETSH